MEQTDVLIIGAGAAGMAAALAAHDGGARVTIMEKGERLGGTAAISGGIIWAANNPRMAEAGIADSEEETLAYFGSLDHGEMDPAVLGAFVREAPEALRFLEGAGALEVSILPGYPDYYLDRPGAKPDGGRALDNELFDYKTLGVWADKVFGDGVIHRMMLRETPLGGSTGFVDPAELQRRAAADLRGFGQALVGRLLSLSDAIAFGVAPALILYLWSLSAVPRFGWFAALALAVCCALRLARFNASIDLPGQPHKSAGFMTGVPAPVGAGLAFLPLYLWFASDWELLRQPVLVAIWALVIAFLMISNLPTLSWGSLRPRRAIRLEVIALAGMVTVALLTEPWLTLVGVCAVYLALMPLGVWRYRRIRLQRASALPQVPTPDLT